MDQTFRPGKAVRSRRSASDALFGSLGIWGCLRIFCAKKRLVLRWVFLLPVLIKLPVIHLFFLKSRKYPIACVIAGLCQQYQLNRKTSPALAGNRYLAARSAAWRRTNPCPSACASVTAVLRSTKAGVQTPATPLNVDIDADSEPLYVIGPRGNTFSGPNRQRLEAEFAAILHAFLAESCTDYRQIQDQRRFANVNLEHPGLSKFACAIPPQPGCGVLNPSRESINDD